MNRRDFFKLGLSALAVALFPTKGYSMPTQNYSGDTLTEILKDLYGKTGQTPPAMLMDTLARQVDEERKRSEILKSWITLDGKVNSKYIDLPITVISSVILEENKTSVTFDIPGIYRHIIVIGSGRTTHTGNPAINIVATLNGDTGANYDTETMYRLNNVDGGGQNLAAASIPIGTFTTADSDANASGTLFGIFPHSQSSFWKAATTIGGGYFTGAAGAVSFSDFGEWENTNPITSITIATENSPTSSLLAGTAISIIGVK